MDPRLNKMLTPAKLGPIQLRNRIIKAATFEGMTPQGRPNDRLLEHHAQLARGGVGMSTVAYCAVSDAGRTFGDQMAMVPALVPELQRLSEAVHAEGGAVALQLGHAGFFTKHRVPGRPFPKGPSWDLNPYGLVAGQGLVRPMNEADIHQVIEDFGDAAARAVEAGFDAVELHLGHGYLLSQFLSPATNRRRDAWGGSLDGRLKLPLAVVAEVRERVGQQIAVLAKMNLEDGFDGGLTLTEAISIAKALEASQDLDALVLSGGFTSRSAMYLLRGGRPLKAMVEVEKSRLQKMALAAFGPLLVKPWPFEELFLLPLARQVRAATSMPLVLLGGIVSADNLRQADAEGFDFVQMGRALLQDPALPRRLAAGEVEGSECIHCNLCITEMDRPAGVRCVLPETASAPAKYTPKKNTKGKRRQKSARRVTPSPQRVLVTGAFGSLGRDTLAALQRRGIALRSFDRPTKANKRVAASRLGRDIEQRWGDIRDQAMLPELIAGCDAIIHLAAVLPPHSEAQPSQAAEVNVSATKALIRAAEAQTQAPRFIYPSSVAAYGPYQGHDPVRTDADPLKPSDHYTHHKARCEAMLRDAALPWVICRVGVALPVQPLKVDLELLSPLLKIAPSNPLEVVHSLDVAHALAAAVSCDEAIERVLLLGGGGDCRIRHRDLLAALCRSLGLPRLPDEAFGEQSYYTHWLDTAEAQRLLNFQRHGWEAIQQDLYTQMSRLRAGIRPLRPLAGPVLPTLARMAQKIRRAG